MSLRPAVPWILACVAASAAACPLPGWERAVAIGGPTLVADEGVGYRCDVPQRLVRATLDSSAEAQVRGARLLEDGRELGPGRTSHEQVRFLGGGRFSLWGTPASPILFFSASDGSDPRTSGRAYELRYHVRLSRWALAPLALPLLALLAAWCFPRAGTIARAPLDPAEPVEPTSHASRIAGGVVAIVLGGLLAAWTSHVAFWLGVATGTIGGVIAAASLATVLAARLGREPRADAAPAVVTVLVSVFVFVVCFEAVLGLAERRALARAEVARAASAPAAPTEAARPVDEVSERLAAAVKAGFPAPVLSPEALASKASRRGVLALPPEWELRNLPPAEVPAGATRAYRWHGALHAVDAHGFRWTGPPPAREPGVARVVLLGDSMTFGAGVAAEWTFPRLVQAELGRRGLRVQVINTGVCGWQTEDVLRCLRELGPGLEPDLLVYVACHNDLLPAGVMQAVDELAWPSPLPDALQAALLARSRVLRFAAHGYDVVLRAAGIRAGFYDHILAHPEHRARFAADTAAMNALARSPMGLPPIMAIVIDQFPDLEGPGYRVTQDLQRILTEGGFDLIPVDDYYRRFDGVGFAVSQWEGHPDEECHGIFAGLLVERLARHPALAASRAGGGE